MPPARLALLLLAAVLLAAAAAPTGAVKPPPVARVGAPDGYGAVSSTWSSGDRALSLVRRVRALDGRLPNARFTAERVGKNLSVLVQGRLAAAHDDTIAQMFALLARAAELERAGLVLDLSEVTHLGDELLEKALKPALEHAEASGTNVLLLYSSRNTQTPAAPLLALAQDLSRVTARDVVQA